LPWPFEQEKLSFDLIGGARGGHGTRIVAEIEQPGLQRGFTGGLAALLDEPVDGAVAGASQETAVGEKVLSRHAAGIPARCARVC